MDLTNAHPSEVEFIQNSPSEMELHKTILNINGFIAVLINSVAVYIILKHSPSQIGTYKYHLLNIVVSFHLVQYLHKKHIKKFSNSKKFN
jgi:hypothetical protein